jgi:hypothetical protein
LIRTRRLRPYLFHAAVVLLMMCRATAAQAQVAPETTHGELVVNFWKPEPDLTIQNVSFVEPLGIEDKRFTEFRVALRPGRKHKLRFSYVPMEYSETGKSVEGTFTFQGRTYSVNLPVDYKFKWELFRFGYEWDFISLDHGYLGVIGEVKYNKVNATINAASVATTSTDAKVPIPTIGGVARGYLGDYFSVTAELTGLNITRNGRKGKFYDLDVFAQLNFSKSFAAQAGYRRLDVDYLWDDDQGTFLMKGPYFGATVRF